MLALASLRRNLCLLLPTGDLRQPAKAAACTPDSYDVARIFPQRGFALALTSIPWREAWKYGERSFRCCELDLAQAAAALGWRARVLPQPPGDDVTALLGASAA